MLEATSIYMHFTSGINTTYLNLNLIPMSRSRIQYICNKILLWELKNCIRNSDTNLSKEALLIPARYTHYLIRALLSIRHTCLKKIGLITV